MFAPPSPLVGSRPTSAAGDLPNPHDQAFNYPRSPSQQQPGLHRSNSFSWKHELGLPPPPSEIDALGDSLDQALIPNVRPSSRARSKSPAARAPSRYDLAFGGLEDPAEQRDRTQDHMNMVTKHPKVKVDVVLSSNVFEAGGSISGKVELTCTTSQRLRIGQIAIELEAVEQLTSRDHAATQLFLYNRTMFQGDNLPPSNAVLPAAPVNGHWTARKGRTSFPFTFRVPSSAPSCVTFAGNASLRYGLKATVQTWYNDEKMIVTARREAFVLEKWSDQYHPRFREPVEAVGDTRLFMGGNGAVWLEAGVTEQLFWGGGQMLVRCGIKNNTKRHLSGIKVALARRLIFPVGSPEGLHDSPDKVSLEPRITEIVHDQIFKGREYEFDPNAESVCTVAVDVPRDLRTIRKTRLFEVRTFALVSLLLGSFAKDLTIEIPIYVAQSASGQPPARENPDNIHHGPPHHAIPQRPHSSMGHQQQHHHPQHFQQHPHPAQSYGHHGRGHAPQMDPGMIEIQRLAAERGWSPAPTFDPAHRAGPSSRPASTAPGMIQLPSQAQPFALGPDGTLQWNPAANNWNASRLVTPAGAAGYNIQRSMSAAPDVFSNVAHSPAAGPTDQAALMAMQRSMSTSPGPAAFGQPANFMPAQQAPGMGDRRNSLPSQGPHGGALPQHPSYQNIQQEVLPPMPQPQTINGPSQISQQYSGLPPQPQMPAYSGGGGAPPIAGLATIEEDSESQAGTIKTLKQLPTIGKTGTKGTNGNSVSRSNVEHFEAMAEAEEDEEDIKRQMIAMGMEPDEDAFSSQDAPTERASVRPAEKPASISTAASTSRTQASSTSTYRPSVNDIFQSQSQEPAQSRQVEANWREAAPVETTAANVSRPQDHASVSQQDQDSESRRVAARRSSVVSLRRPSSSQGHGLQALESNLVRSTTPKIASSSRNVVTMANVARADSTSSPLSSPIMCHDDAPRSRKNSALRAAALAREEAERRSAEQQARAVEERQRQMQAEEERRAAAAEEEAARREAARIRAEEQQKLERERIAEQARRQREQREQEEERRQRAEAERVATEQRMQRQRQEQEAEERRKRAEAERIAHEQRLNRQEEEERRSRQAAEAERAARELAQASFQLAEMDGVSPKSSVILPSRNAGAMSILPSSIAPSVPSKTTAPNFAAPCRTNDRDRVALKQQAVHRIGGWLSNASSPTSSHTETPGTPSASVLSVMRKEEPNAAAVRSNEAQSSFAYRSPSQVINPMWDGNPSPSQAVEGSMPKSRTMADLASTKASTATQPAAVTAKDEPGPQLSAELRALVDGSDIRPARKAGNALKEHPINRRLSGLGSTEKASAAVVPQPATQAKTSPSWPRPGLPTFEVGAKGRIVSGASLHASVSSPDVQSSNERRVTRNPEAREVGIPSRVERMLMTPNAEGTARGKDEPSYDSRSARGGRGGRVTSVAQLWSTIAGDEDVGSSLGAPQTDPNQPRSASPSSASTVKPKPRRSTSSNGGGAPALDFSKKAMSSSSSSSGVTAIAATFGGVSTASKPESMKSSTAQQFLNTSSAPKAVFAKVGDQSPAPTSPVKRPLPKPVLQPGAVPAPQLVRPTAMRAQPTERSSRRISTQLLSTFEKEKDQTPNPTDSVREMMSKVAVDSTILGALQGMDNLSHDMSTLRCADGTEIKMSGRGTTKAIGENKLKSLRSIWGS